MVRDDVATIGSVLSDIDLAPLIFSHLPSNLTIYDASVPQPERSALRSLCRTTCALVDSQCTAYTDRRLTLSSESGALSAAEVGRQVVAALRRLRIEELCIEGLDEDALSSVLSEACKPIGAALWSLALPRGGFCGPWAALSELSSLPRLKHLDLSGCGELSDPGLEALVAAAPLLSWLRLTVNSRIVAPMLSCPHLRSVTLAICSNLRDEAVTHLCSGAPGLRDLSLWRCSSLERPTIRGACLQSVNLCECVSLEREAIAALQDGTSCPELVSLLLAGCDALVAASEEAAPIGAPPLRTLDLSDMQFLTDETLSASLAAAPHLTRLDISRSEALIAPDLGGERLTALICAHCTQLSDDAVSAACDRSPALATLMLSLCSSLVSPRLRGELLTEVNLSGCHLLTDAAVSHLCRNSPRLARLGLSLCSALVSPEVGGDVLARLDLAHCDQLASPDVRAPKLVELNLSGCAQLQDAALVAACAACPALVKLCIDSCSKLSTPMIESLSLQALSCQAVQPSVLEAAADKTRCPALRKVRSSTSPTS